MGQSTLEDFSGEVSPLLAAKWTLRNDPRVRHRQHGSGDILTATLAGDDEGVQVRARSLEHGNDGRRTRGEDQ